MYGKEFGKLTRRQAQQVYSSLQEMNEEAKDFAELASNTDNLDDLVVPWTEWYNFPYVYTVAGFLLKFNLIDLIQASLNEPDPQQSILDTLSSDLGDTLPVDHYTNEDKQEITAVLMALQGQINAIKQYSQPMSELIRKAVEGDLDCLFRAVTIDRSVVSNFTVAKFISKAQMCDDETFMNRLAKAITKTKPVPSKAKYNDLRYMIEVLAEGVGLEHHTTAQLQSLLIDDLELYNDESDYSTRAFRKLIEKRNKLVGT